MTLRNVVVLVSLMVGGVLLGGANVALRRLERPDRGTERIAGCCGVALSAEITERRVDVR